MWVGGYIIRAGKDSEMLLFHSVLFYSTWHPLARRIGSFRNTNSANKSGEVIAG